MCDSVNMRLLYTLNAERAIPHLQMREALSGDARIQMGMKKPHLINCEATCIHEEVAKRIPNVRFTRFLHRNYEGTE